MLPDTQLMLVTFKVIIILRIPKILHAYQCSIVLLRCAESARKMSAARGRAVTHEKIVSDHGPTDLCGQHREGGSKPRSVLSLLCGTFSGILGHRWVDYAMDYLRII